MMMMLIMMMITMIMMMMIIIMMVMIAITKYLKNGDDDNDDNAMWWCMNNDLKLMRKEIVNNVISGSHAPCCTAFDPIIRHRCWHRLIGFWHVEIDGDVVQDAACHSNLAYFLRTEADLMTMKHCI